MRVDLVNNDINLIVAYFVSDNNQSHSISGKLYTVDCWDENLCPNVCSFFADVTIKWDGCSHFWFFGQDSNYEEKDSCYHICGARSYIGHVRIMLFAYEIMVQVLNEKVFSMELDDYEALKKLGILDGYDIIFR